MPEQSNDYRVVVFGAGGVGKSSLVLRFVKGTFRDTYIPTIEDTYRQVISCDKSVCTLQITDTTGSHQFPAMQRLSISKGHAFILVYSITSRQSLEELKPIYEQICEIKGDVESIPIMLVGNKCDESPNREVESSEAEVLARKWKCAFMETSAKLILQPWKDVFTPGSWEAWGRVRRMRFPWAVTQSRSSGQGDGASWAFEKLSTQCFKSCLPMATYLSFKPRRTLRFTKMLREAAPGVTEATLVT